MQESFVTSGQESSGDAGPDSSDGQTGLFSRLRPMGQVLRTPHWIKNALVLLPLVFAVRFTDAQAWLCAMLAFLAFCTTASALYIINDIADRHSDRHHPRKCRRPIAAGRLSVPVAIAECVFLLALGASLALSLRPVFGLVLLGYLLLQLAYNAYLKHHMLLDAIALACGFVLRAVGGAVAIGVVISPWLVICTFSLCLFLGFCKRHCEILVIADRESATQHRKTLAGYTPQLLTHLITLAATLAVISFLLYATSDRTVQEFGSHLFVYTMPLVVYGVCRIAMQSMRGIYSDPNELMLRDRGVQVTAALWLLTAIVIVVYGRGIEHWLASF